MIDICFNDSVCGMLRLVQGIIKSDDIFSLSLSLNIGNIDCDDLLAEQLRNEIEYDRYYLKNITDVELENRFNEELKQERKKFEKIIKFINGGHKIRVWISNIANNRCGLYWLCNLLQEYKNELSLITCPGYEYDDKTNESTENRRWSLFNNLEFIAGFVKEAHVVCEKEKIAYSKRWIELVEENAQLRILVDDMIVGVNEDFFDNVILSFVSAKPETQNRIMGNVLHKWQSADIFFLSKRIERLIENGKIKVCEDRVAKNGCYWGRTIALA